MRPLQQQSLLGSDVAALIQSVFDTLHGLASDEPASTIELTPAVIDPALSAERQHAAGNEAKLRALSTRGRRAAPYVRRGRMQDQPDVASPANLPDRGQSSQWTYAYSSLLAAPFRIAHKDKSVVLSVKWM